MMAQLWRYPEAISVAPEVKSTTCFGVKGSVLLPVPVPVWPLEFDPQHRTPPALVSAQVWSSPPVTWEMPVKVPLPPAPTTAAGRSCWTLLPLPSSADLFAPQHNSDEFVRMAQVSSYPVFIDATPLRGALPAGFLT